MKTKTDNHNIFAKLDLRRRFLNRYPARSVLDCFMGSGEVWGRLRKDYAVKYWGVDVKPAKGRIKIDSERILAQPGWGQDVVDLDAYGSPWAHWLALLSTCDHAVTVFLTVGLIQMGGGGGLSGAAKGALGIAFTRDMPQSLGGHLHDFATGALLGVALRKFKVVECAEALNPGGHARYFGIRLEPLRTPDEKNLSS